MLVLSRKENETIEFPSLGVVIRVFGLTRRRVQVGIDAPISLKITRGEKLANGPTATGSTSSGAVSAGPPASVRVDSIAEHVIGAEFKRLESELDALAELASDDNQRRARKVSADLADRMTRIKRAVTASLSERDMRLADELRGECCDAPPPASREELVRNRPAAAERVCVRQSSVGYSVTESQAERTCFA